MVKMGVYKDIAKRTEYVDKYQKIYNEKKYECECGVIVKLRSKHIHLKTQKHKNMMEIKRLNEQINKVILIV
jgi:hypothetical protein